MINKLLAWAGSRTGDKARPRPAIAADGDGNAWQNTNRTEAETVYYKTETEQVRDHSACLVIIRGARLGARIVPGDEPLIIGRTVEADFQISARSVSRKHCRVYRQDGQYWVEDLGSTNSTYLNDKPVARSPLRDGDHVRISETVLKFIGEGNIEAGYHSELHENSVRDPLTGLYNRRHMMHALQSESARCRRDPRRRLALVIMDIDFFKAINDTYGHVAGDGVLKHLGRIATERLRADDVIARIGGEEFAIMLPGTRRDGAVELADTIRQAVALTPFRIENQDRHITLSAGVAEWHRGMGEITDILRAADEQLYLAKSRGRNQVR